MADHVLVIGNNTVDTVYRVRGVIGPDAKRRAEAVAVHPGGQAANVAYTLALLGCAVEYVGAFGDDDASTLSRGSLAEVGIGLERCVTVPHCPAHHATVMVDTLTGSRSIVMYKDDRLRLDPGVITPDLLDTAWLVYLDNHEQSASLSAAALARERRVPVVADLEELSEQTLLILPYVDTLIAPVSVLRELTGADDPYQVIRAARLLGPRIVVATAGADGAFGLDVDDELVHVPSLPCAVVDSTGAGDAFHAGYIAALRQGVDFVARLEFATLVASLKCGIHGPRLTSACIAGGLIPASSPLGVEPAHPTHAF